MDYKNRIEREAKRRQIYSLVHFTNIENIEGIVEHGLLSREEIVDRGLSVLATDPWRLDGIPSAISLSVTNINSAMLDNKRAIWPKDIWAVIHFRPSILWTHACRFCHRNASHKEISKSRVFLGGPWAFERMFEDKVSGASPEEESYREMNNIRDCCPTRLDAEVQVLERIAPELIMGVVVDRASRAARVQALMDRINKIDGDDRNVLVHNF